MLSSSTNEKILTVTNMVMSFLNDDNVSIEELKQSIEKKEAIARKRDFFFR